MDDARNTKKIYEADLHQERPKGKRKAKQKNYMENDSRKMGIVNWKQVAQDRDGSRTATREALMLLG
jgi:hypothetical protein